MAEGKTSEAQKAASKKYREKNKEKQRITSYRTTTRMYLKNHATLDDLEEFKQLIADREKELK